MLDGSSAPEEEYKVPFLQDILGQAEQQVRNQVTGVQNSVKNAVGIEISNVRNTAANTVSNGVNSVIGSAVNAIQDVAQGNISGAIQSLNPAALASSAFSGLLSSSSQSISLSDPGYSSATSSSGGITPGDALQGALARPDPLLNFLWYCQLPVIGPPAGSEGAAPGVSNMSNAISTFVSNILGGSLFGSSQGGSITTQASSQLPWYYVEEASCPMRQFTHISVFRDGRDRNYPSRYTLGQLSLGIYADNRNTSIQYLQSWNNAILQPFDASTLNLGGGWGRPAQFKKPIFIYFLDPAKNQLMVLEYVEAWPVSIHDYALVSATSERIVHHVDFSVGDVLVSLFNVSPNVTQALVQTAGSIAGSAVNSVRNAVGQSLNSLL